MYVASTKFPLVLDKGNGTATASDQQELNAVLAIQRRLSLYSSGGQRLPYRLVYIGGAKRALSRTGTERRARRDLLRDQPGLAALLGGFHRVERGCWRE